MNMDPMISLFNSEFKKTMLEQCDFSEKELTPDIACRFFSALKVAISHAARAGIVQFIKSHDVDEPFIVRNGIKFHAKRPSVKQFLTQYGVIDLERCNYQGNSGGKTIQPLDEKWGMVGEFATPEVRECIMFHTAFMSPGEIETCMQKSAMFQPSKTAIDNILRETGELTQEHYEQLHKRMLADKPLPDGAEVLVCSMDGANMLIREPGGKKGRPIERPLNQKDTGLPESAYRNAMTGVFTFYQAGHEESLPKRIDANYISRSPEPGFTTFKEDFEREFSWYDQHLGKNVTRVLLHDGGRNIWNYCDENSLYSNCLTLLDFYHATEHLSKAAEAIFGKKSSKGKAWYCKWEQKLKYGKSGVQGLISSIKYYQSELTGKSRKEALMKELTFFVRNAKRMDYSSFLENGLPIGSGPVEAGCKTIVKQRMCKSGQRWSLKGAQHVLHLRSIVKSDRWDIYWDELEAIRLAS